MRAAVSLALMIFGLAVTAAAQRPTTEQARTLLQTRPDLVNRLRTQIASSGLTAAQIRARLTAAGYPADLLDAYLESADSTQGPAPSTNVLDAVRALGLSSGDEDLTTPDSVPGRPGTRRTDLERDTLPNQVFGLDVFRRVSSQFQALASGPVDPSYRLGPGDVLVLILTGDVELAHTLEVTREGFVIIPQVGQLYVSGLTMTALENLLYSRLGRVYSGVSRAADARTRFQVTVARLRMNQVFVIGDVTRPGSYQMSSAGTVLTALYLAGGPTERGNLRRIEVRRGGKLIDSLDIYSYLLEGRNEHDIRLESGDVVFVPVRGARVTIKGAITRPAIYEMAPGETLRQLVAAAGGFEPSALRRRIQIERILPPDQRQPGGRDRVLLDITEDQVGDDLAPAVPLVAGDVIRVFSVSKRRRNAVMVAGNVWVEGPVGYTPGMLLSEAIRLAGGPKPDVYLDQILISRLESDSTRSQLRSAFVDSTGQVRDDIPLREDDEITVFSRTTFRAERFVVVTGAVNKPGRIRYRAGMTLRDAVLEAEGVTEEAWLAEAEVARMPEDRAGGAIASTFRAPMDSTYLFDRGPNGEYQGPPGAPARGSGAPETVIQPYDNILIFRQPDWELQRTVTLTGQVRFPGQYALRTKTERISDLLDRAGGLTKEAYPLGGALFRRFARRDFGSPGPAPVLIGDSTEAVLEADTVAVSLTDLDAVERVGLDLPSALREPNGRQNVILLAGDSLHIPEYDPTVRVAGAVNSPTTLIHRQGWDVDDYVAAAGGYSRRGDKGRTYVIQPSGRLESVNRRFLLPDSKPSPAAGGVVFVPERDPADKKDWVGLFGSIAQILASTVAIVVVIATR